MKMEGKETSRGLWARCTDIGTEDSMSRGQTQMKLKVNAPAGHSFQVVVFCDCDSCAVLYDFDVAAQSMRPAMMEFPRSTLPTDSKVRPFQTFVLHGA